MGKGFRSFILGGAVGAAIALLFAKRTGEETRAIVAEKVDDLWGQGQKYYTQGRTVVQDNVASTKAAADKKNDELREKIESARAAIAEQVAKNAVAARDAISDKVPVANEKISQAVDVVKGQIDAAAAKINETAADLAARARRTEDAPVASVEAASEVIGVGAPTEVAVEGAAVAEVAANIVDAARNA